MMTDITLLIDKCIVEDEKKGKWKYAAHSYNSAMEILQRKDDYTNEEVKQFQLLIDQSYLMF